MLFFPQLTFRKFTNSTITWPNPPVLSQHMCPSLGTSVVFKEEEKFQTWDLHGAWEKVDNLNQKDLQNPKMCILPSSQNIFDACNCSGSFKLFLLSAESSQSLLFLSLRRTSDLMCSCLKLTVCAVWLESKHGEHLSSLNGSVSVQHKPDAGACSSPVPSVISLSLSHPVSSRHH